MDFDLKYKKMIYGGRQDYSCRAHLLEFRGRLKKCVCIFVDKIDNQLKILQLSTFINKLNLSIDNYRQILSSIDLSTTFLMIDFDRHVMSWYKEHF